MGTGSPPPPKEWGRRTLPTRGLMTDMQLQRVDLALAVGAGLDGAGGADQVARAGERVRAQADADVDRGQARKRDSLRVADDEVGVAVPVRVDSLDVDDPAHRYATGGMPLRAVRGLDRL